MELEFSPLYEPLTLHIGNKTVESVIDCTSSNCIHVADVCQKCEQKAKQLAVLEKKAAEQGDTKALLKVNTDTALLLEEAITAAIGAESYKEILDACGNGRKVEKSDCNAIFGQIMNAITQIVMTHRMADVDEKAAHYLAEVANAQSEPDTEQ